jgi:cytochrome b involved in lipid metabolism
MSRRLARALIAVAAAASLIGLAAPAQASNGSYTMAQVRKHSTPGDCWTVINRTVYNLTPWVARHPGGSRAIAGLCGRDGTRTFLAQHRGDPQPTSILASYRIGTLRR